MATFFVMGFCDIVGISSDYMQSGFGWSSTMTGFVPSMVFVWFFFLGIPVGNKMNRLGRKNTVLLSMAVTVIGMFLPLCIYSSVTCVIAYILLGVGNAILQISLNPLLSNVIHNRRLLTSSMTAGQVIKAVSSLLGPEIVLFVILHFGEDHWYYCFPVLGTITLLLGLWLAATPIRREPDTTEPVSMSGSFALLKNRAIMVLFMGIFFVVGVDVATNYIGSKLMAMRYDWSAVQVKYAPQVYFFSRTVGALLGTFLLTRISGIRYFRVNIVLCGFSCLLLMAGFGAVPDLVCIGCIGFFASSVFSIIYSFAFHEYPSKMNQVSGLMITAVAGGGIVTPVLGFSIDVSGIEAGLSVILLCILYLVYCAFSMKTDCRNSQKFIS